MKRFIMSLALVLASSASYAAAKHYDHDYGTALGEIALENACVTDTEVRTVHPVKVCEQWAETPVSRSESSDVYFPTCLKSSVQQLARPRAYTYSVCTRYVYEHDNQVCAQYGTATGWLPSTIRVRVSNAFGEHSFPTTEQNFTFPACN